MVNDKILETSRNAILTHLGYLDDIPYDLANTIANNYYKYFLVAEDILQNPIPKSVMKNEDIFSGLKDFSKKYRTTEFQYKVTPNLIKELRSFKNKQQIKSYNH